MYKFLLFVTHFMPFVKKVSKYKKKGVYLRESFVKQIAMEKLLFHPTIIAIVLAIIISACESKDPESVPESKQMTLELQNPTTVEIEMSGSGSVTIDWGDNSAIEEDKFSSGYSKYRHEYSGVSACTITVTGVNVSGFVCNKILLTGLDVSENIDLVSLYCDHNRLTKLDVSKNTALETLSCDHNELTTLDVSRNIKLTTLWCHNNRLDLLDIEKNIALSILNCEYNRFTDLDVTKNIILRELFCGNNRITALNVNNNLSLRVLDCGKNLLTSLDMDKNTELTEVYCAGNQLTDLDMTRNTALFELDCASNRLQAESLNELFQTLHNNTIQRKEKTISINGNPGRLSCDRKIAEERGWQVY